MFHITKPDLFCIFPFLSLWLPAKSGSWIAMRVSRAGLNLSETGLLFLFSLPVSPSAFSYSLLPSFKPALLLIFLAHGLQDLSSPTKGLNLRPHHWKHGLLTVGPWGNIPNLLSFNSFSNIDWTPGTTVRYKTEYLRGVKKTVLIALIALTLFIQQTNEISIIIIILISPILWMVKLGCGSNQGPRGSESVPELGCAQQEGAWGGVIKKRPGSWPHRVGRGNTSHTHTHTRAHAQAHYWSNSIIWQFSSVSVPRNHLEACGNRSGQAHSPEFLLQVWCCWAGALPGGPLSGSRAVS